MKEGTFGADGCRRGLYFRFRFSFLPRDFGRVIVREYFPFAAIIRFLYFEATDSNLLHFLLRRFFFEHAANFFRTAKYLFRAAVAFEVLIFLATASPPRYFFFQSFAMARADFLMPMRLYFAWCRFH